MPLKSVYVKPSVFMTFKGTKVYNLYKDDDVDNGPKTYSFTFDPVNGSDYEAEFSFDVRDLSTWQAPNHPPFLTDENDTQKNKKAWDKWYADGVERKAIKAAIRAAIVKGELTAERVKV